MAGVVTAVGEGVQDKIKVGMHVALGGQTSRGCGQCTFCRKGHPSRCQDKPKEIEHGGVVGSFGMSQYALYSSDRIYEISEKLPFEEGAFLEPVATTVHGAKRLRITPGDKVLVIGAGNLGLINAQTAQAFGADVMVAEVNEERCALSQSFGFATINPFKADLKEEVDKRTGNKGADVVILAVGINAAHEQGLQVLARMGRMLFFSAGYPSPELNIKANDLHYKEYELIGTWGADPLDYEIAADLLGSYKVKVDRLISHRIAVDEVEHAFELAATPGNYRVTLNMW